MVPIDMCADVLVAVHMQVLRVPQAHVPTCHTQMGRACLLMTHEALPVAAARAMSGTAWLAIAQVRGSLVVAHEQSRFVSRFIK